MARPTIVGDIHGPMNNEHVHQMIGEIHRAMLIFTLNKLGLKAERAYKKIIFDIETSGIDDVRVVWSGDKVDGKDE